MFHYEKNCKWEEGQRAKRVQISQGVSLAQGIVCNQLISLEILFLPIISIWFYLESMVYVKPEVVT